MAVKPPWMFKPLRAHSLEPRPGGSNRAEDPFCGAQAPGPVATAGTGFGRRRSPHTQGGRVFAVSAALPTVEADQRHAVGPAFQTFRTSSNAASEPPIDAEERPCPFR